MASNIIGNQNVPPGTNVGDLLEWDGTDWTPTVFPEGLVDVANFSAVGSTYIQSITADSTDPLNDWERFVINNNPLAFPDSGINGTCGEIQDAGLVAGSFQPVLIESIPGTKTTYIEFKLKGRVSLPPTTGGGHSFALKVVLTADAANPNDFTVNPSLVQEIPTFTFTFQNDITISVAEWSLNSSNGRSFALEGYICSTLLEMPGFDGADELYLHILLSHVSGSGDLRINECVYQVNAFFKSE